MKKRKRLLQVNRTKTAFYNVALFKNNLHNTVQHSSAMDNIKMTAQVAFTTKSEEAIPSIP